MKRAARKLVCCGIILGFVCTPSRASTETENNLFALQCTILDREGQPLRSYPGWLCAFFPDGTLLVGKGRKLSFLNSKLLPIWEKDIPAHHMFHVSQSGKSLFVLSSEIRRLKGVEHRFDKILKLNKQGEVSHSFAFYRNPSVATKPLSSYQWDPLSFPSLKYEATHVNSVQEIPANRSPLPALAEGNVIVNDTLNKMVYVIDAGLKKVLWRLPYKEFSYERIHDVQVLKNGNLLLYKNKGGPSTFSSLDEIDPVKKEVVWTYTGAPASPFTAPLRGSVQLLSDDSVLFSYEAYGKPKAKIVSRAGEVLEVLDLSKSFSFPVQGIRLEKLETFLKNNAGL